MSRPACKHQGVVGIVVRLAVAASVEKAGVVQNRAVALLHLTEALDQVSQTLGLVKIPLAFVLSADALARSMSQTVGIFGETQKEGNLLAMEMAPCMLASW